MHTFRSFGFPPRYQSHCVPHVSQIGIALADILGGALAKSSRKLENLVKSAIYRDAVEALRDTLRGWILDIFDGDWAKIRNDHHIYTIVARAKDPDRTLDKFNTMLHEVDPLTGEKKFKITADDFYRHIPDLAAARLVVVDAADIFDVAELVRQNFVPPRFELPSPDMPHLQAYRVRRSAISTYDTTKFQQAGYKIDNEPGGYCSVHFVFQVGSDFLNGDTGCAPEKKAAVRQLDQQNIIPKDKWTVEIQVRTLMDEAWSETDHFLRYRDAALKGDVEIRDQFAALSAYLQAANHHVSLIRQSILRKGKKK